ncbi:MAG TPA: hypothetical protein VH497_05080 [Vicinamibacterales bacterium]|jgi:hypothetical protein
MPPLFRRSLPIAGAAVLMTAALALADPPAGATPHVRPETQAARALLHELLDRSPTAWQLVDEIDRRDLIVYIRHRVFTDATLNGRIGLLRSNQPTRFLVLELAAARTAVDQLAALGHELQHAAEIARLGRMLSPAGLARYYAAIGEETSPCGETRTFETRAAQEMSMTIRRELLRPTGRTGQ